MSAPVIEKGVPIPPTRKTTGVTATLRAMEVGDSAVLPTSRYSVVQRPAKDLGIKITVRKLDAATFRVWRTA